MICLRWDFCGFGRNWDLLVRGGLWILDFGDLFFVFDCLVWNLFILFLFVFVGYLFLGDLGYLVWYRLGFNCI